MASNFKEILYELLQSDFDERATKDEDYAKQLKNVHNEFVRRNRKLTTLLDDYMGHRNKRINSNGFFKKFIFWLFVVVFLTLTVVVVIVFLTTDINNPNVTTVISLLSVAGTYLASIMTVFQIMTKYLFPPDEEKDTIEMIKTVINNDVEVEKMMSEAIEESGNVYINKLREYKKLLDENIISNEDFNALKEQTIKKIKNSED